MVVLEPRTTECPPDRLDEEFDVAFRLASSMEPEQLHALLAQCRPRLLLVKGSLDSIDARLTAVCLAHDVEIMILAKPVYGLLGPARVRRFGGLPWLRLRCGAGRPGHARVKRCLDLALVLLSLPLSIPLMLLIAGAVSTSGPPLYLQRRVGEGGRLFRMVKFRTMHVGAERETGPVLAGPNDSRITRVGRLMRRSRLDELPQLWNVLRGEMSLVGPRPERPEFIADIRLQLPDYDLRHHIRPGLTGIAQLTGGYAATVEEKLRCDLLYLNCRSLRLDLSLLVLTILDLLRGFRRG
ncbi:sugar transferase [Micromonospora sp. CPCC 206061]|uniref:sugar transferase n=1 Tax=Micromonospora sp. CPCC 206061 TaxID=3122410 RepID=UPI002FF319C8